jgi:hypothetical protein
VNGQHNLEVDLAMGQAKKVLCNSRKNHKQKNPDLWTIVCRKNGPTSSTRVLNINLQVSSCLELIDFHQKNCQSEMHEQIIILPTRQSRGSFRFHRLADWVDRDQSRPSREP